MSGVQCAQLFTVSSFLALASQPPNILMVVIDDFGWSNAGMLDCWMD
jgi:hypothetical protein